MMTTISNLPPEIENYLKLVESDTPRFCPEQHALAALVRKAFREEDLRIETERLANYIKLIKYFPYDDLLPWEKFIFTLWNCVYRPDGLPRWDSVFCMLGRGAGKDGFIAFDGMAMISPYNPSRAYDVDICANCEDQAMRPVTDLVDVLDEPKNKAKLNKHFYHTKELVQGRINRGIMHGYTKNPDTKDGLRSGKLIFNEVHQYQNYNNIKVFTTGLGKKADPRTGIFTSNGKISDGPLDDYLERSERILFEGEADGGFLPFVCRLHSVEEVHDEANWFMANPSLFYFPTLLNETRKEYRDWKEHPEQNGDFLPKRMGLREGFAETSVTDYEKVKATNKPIPKINGWSCTVGIDYAELSDWAAVNLHFRRGNDRLDINHAWLCLKSKTLSRLQIPWQEWVKAGYITAVDDVSISPDLLAEYIREAGRIYNIRKLAMDQFRWTLVAEAMKKIGFDANDKNRVKLVRPSDIMQIDPVIQECFDRGYFNWGNYPPLRWAVNNTKRVPSSRKIGVDTGNFIYAKIEPKSRKTDPWMALVASMIIETELGSGETVELPKIGAIAI